MLDTCVCGGGRGVYKSTHNSAVISTPKSSSSHMALCVEKLGISIKSRIRHVCSLAGAGVYKTQHNSTIHSPPKPSIFTQHGKRGARCARRLLKRKVWNVHVALCVVENSLYASKRLFQRVHTLRWAMEDLCITPSISLQSFSSPPKTVLLFSERPRRSLHVSVVGKPKSSNRLIMVVKGSSLEVMTITTNCEQKKV
jgi:hypothetical protein